jgi:hypothetical protein
MAALAKSLAVSLCFTLASAAAKCRAIPGDHAWPAVSTWQRLNETIQGRLIATVPMPAVCHAAYHGTLLLNDTYSATECATVQAEWPQDVTL